MFQASPAHLQGVHSCIKQFLNLFIYLQYCEYIQTNWLYKSIYYESHIDEFKTHLLLTGDDKKVKQLFYAVVGCLTVGR